MDPFRLQGVAGLQTLVHNVGVANDRDVAPFDLYLSFAQRNRLFLFRDFPFHVVEKRIVDKQDRIIVPDCALHQPFRIVRG